MKFDLNENEFQRLRQEVQNYLVNDYKIDLNVSISNNNRVKSIQDLVDIIVNNWFADLENKNTHLTSDLIAAEIAMIIQKYHQ